ncbi:peptidase family C78-domain-containing protein [Gautieria morchelliformis]|nr:peptidase family C78-domain-containing protein [Gautieria morchelliformis]
MRDTTWFWPLLFWPLFQVRNMPEPSSAIDSSEDDIQFLYQTEPVTCQLCSTSLQRLSPEQRNAHYEGHFNQNPASSSTSVPAAHTVPPNASKSPAHTSGRKIPPSRSKRNVPAEQNIFWFHAQPTPPPKNFTPGLIPILKRVLHKTHAKGATIRAVLCHDRTTHVAVELWDSGWGCGYRNFLMACTALINQTTQPLYFPLLDDPLPPGVRNLQYWIEDAWADGFDRDGAKDLQHKLVGTKKWIGTAGAFREASACLSFLYFNDFVSAKLVDFPKSARGPKAVTEWVMNYFSPASENTRPTNAFNALKGANPIILTDRMPLILQHSGHSRTVVGFEVNKKGEPNLLVFDPSLRPSKEIRQAALTKYSPSSPSFSLSKKTVSSCPVLNIPRLYKTDSEERKRRASNSLADSSAREMKRVRGGLETPSPGLDRDIIVIDDESEAEKLEESLDPTKVLNFFRFSQSKLGKKDRYQILYFPLDPPLDDAERWSRRVVTSEIVK